MSLVKRKQVAVELANDSYKLSLHELYGTPIKDNISLLSVFNQYMILQALDEDDGTILTPDGRKCLIARLGLTSDWNKLNLIPNCSLPTVATLRFQRAIPDSSEYTGVVAETITDGGCEITERGVCCSTQPLPTLNDTVLKSETFGLGVYSMNAPYLGLTTYYRSYCRNKKGLVYGNILSITIET